MTKAMQKMSMGRGKPIADADFTRRPAGQVEDLSGQKRLIRRSGASGTLLRVAVTIAVVMLLGCGSSSDTPSSVGDSGVPTSDWMKAISDYASISGLSIPGTHDTCTSSIPGWYYFGYVTTQNMGIDDQLQHGIRFLDIRCRLIGNGFAIHHGSVYLGLDFQEVINQCRSFLSAHPNETILMDVGHEYEDQGSTLSFHQVFLNYYNSNRYLDGRDLWYTGTTIPTLGQVRGKIVLLRSFDLDPGTDAIGINIATGGGNSAYSWNQFSTNPDQTVYVESLWTPDSSPGDAYDVKWDAIQQNIWRAKSGASPDDLYMTWTSATMPGWHTPLDFAKNINPGLNINNFPARSGPMGIVIMDFPGDDTIGFIIDSDFVR
jgi:1-phosphatidylinositol phosphodiesterase